MAENNGNPELVCEKISSGMYKIKQCMVGDDLIC